MTVSASTCPLCESDRVEIVYELTCTSSAEDIPGRIARCCVCPMWFKILLDPNGLPKEYPGEFGVDELAQSYLLGDAARTFFRTSLARVSVRASGDPARLLDIGSAQGALIEEALRMGFDAEGLDHCESNVEVARTKGLNVRLAAAEDLVDQKAFDVITMFDIIEHLIDPLAVLNAVARALKPDGELVVYTPNHRALVVVLARLLHAVGFRKPVQEIFGRNHVSFFDDRSLPLALDRTGFAPRLWQRAPYDPSRPGQEMSPLSLAAVTGLERLGMPFGRVLRLLVYARTSASR